MKIHSTAIVSKDAVIGKNVEIGPYTVIGANVTIGEGTVIGSHSVIEGETIIGKNNVFFPFVTIGVEPQDLKYKGEKTKLIIGDNNKIREFCSIHRGTIAAGETRIGSNNLFLAYGHIAHDCRVGDNCIFSNNATLAGHVEVEDYVIIGGLTPIHQFVKIGSHAMIGGASAVNQDIAPFLIAEGNKAKTHGINIVGLKRRGFSDEDIDIIKDGYKIVFRSKLMLETAIIKLNEKYPENKHINYFIEFIKKSERGICR
jgi:UDP-N-acetylglucosamine acyltransferase